MRCIVSDLDGTLLDAQAQVSRRTQEVIAEAMARGVAFAIATGRHVAQVRLLWPEALPAVPVISANGARIHLADGSELHASHLDAALANQLLQPRFVHGVEVGVYRDNAILAWHASGRLGYYTGKAEALPDPAAFRADDVSKVIYCGEHETLVPIEQAIAREFGDRVAMTYSQPHYLEVMAPGVNKGSALTILLRHLGIEAAACAAFGDNLNDTEMLRLAGLPHAMANAHPELFRLAPGARMIGHHDEDGVARALEGLLAVARA